jgi:hypothetical protein
MENKKAIYGVIFAVLAFILFYFFWLDEYLAFNKLKDNPTEHEYVFEDYYWDYPESRYMEDVKILEIETVRDIELVRNYMEDYPEGKGLEEVTELKDVLWDEEIKKYDDLVSGKEATEATKFFKDLLLNMKENNSSTIYVQFKENVVLKDLEDYGAESVGLIDLLSDPSRKISENMLPLKANFSEGNISSLEEIIDDGIKESFEQIFTENFISVSKMESDPEEGQLIINIEYTIRNQLMEGYDLPNIWEYSTGDVFETYLLGIAIDFKFDFAIPGTDDIYKFDMDGNPGENISGIDNIAEGYQRMTSISFANYANHISDQFGLEGIYFKEEPVEETE